LREVSILRTLIARFLTDTSVYAVKSRIARAKLCIHIHLFYHSFILQESIISTTVYNNWKHLYWNFIQIDSCNSVHNIVGVGLLLAGINLEGYNGFPHNVKQLRSRIQYFSLGYVLELEFKNEQSISVRTIHELLCCGMS
jgi:hypothetical protein